MVVKFKFKLEQKVITPFDEKGIISMLGYDDGGNTYYVKTNMNSQWFKEKELKLSPELKKK